MFSIHIVCWMHAWMHAKAYFWDKFSAVVYVTYINNMFWIVTMKDTDQKSFFMAENKNILPGALFFHSIWYSKHIYNPIQLFISFLKALNDQYDHTFWLHLPDYF